MSLILLDEVVSELAKLVIFLSLRVLYLRPVLVKQTLGLYFPVFVIRQDLSLIRCNSFDILI